MVACSPGDLFLSTGGSGGSGGSVSVDDAATGGQNATGGASPTNPGEGGRADMTSGSVDSTGYDHDTDVDPPLPYKVPCSLRGDCPPFCPDHPQECLSCERKQDCSGLFPYCDGLSCVECLNGYDCRFIFGPEFPVCSAGRCVQCQKDSECGAGEFCAFGWCGDCRKSFDCSEDEVCVDLRCIPTKPPTNYDGSGGAADQGSGGAFTDAGSGG